MGRGTTAEPHPSPAPPPAQSPTSFIRSRIANACDGCKARKVKCDGHQPCSYCVRRQRTHACHYTLQRRALRRRSAAAAASSSPGGPRLPQSPAPSAVAAASNGDDASAADDDDAGHRLRPGAPAARRRQSVMMESAEDDTEVPREARLLCDAQGKLIFIGDCAPLSLFQSVRQLVTSRVGQNAFAPETSRYSVLENAPAGGHQQPWSSAPGAGPPPVRSIDVAPAVASYVSATTGLVDLFDEARLADDLLLWADMNPKLPNLTSIIYYLVLAIGLQRTDDISSRAFFGYARDQAFATLSGDLGVGTVQAFTLITVYMLCSCQINSAFLVFGIAVRAAYSIGVHRTEVNARFGPEVHRQRDRLWKSLRVVDLFLSTSMGRPPATSDVDCTVPYRSVPAAGDEEGEGEEVFDLLNASAQILIIIEGIVTEIYSRKKISLQLTEGISLQLREWSARWLQRLKAVVARQSSDHYSQPQISGACQVLSSYYYAVMLVSRPFLMYELFRRLSDGGAPGPAGISAGKSKLADACIDAASFMVDPVLDLINRGLLKGPMPLLVSWLFAASLVLGVGLLGGFGRILEKYTHMSIQALDHFAKSDTHATQYSLIAQSLLTTALEHLERRELQERLRRTETSSQLFGLIPPQDDSSLRPSRNDHDTSSSAAAVAPSPPATSLSRRPRESSSFLQQNHHHDGAVPPTSSPRMGDISSSFFGLADDSLLAGQDGNFWATTYQNDGGDAGSAALNLFPLLEAGGGIDLAHYL